MYAIIAPLVTTDTYFCEALRLKALARELSAGIHVFSYSRHMNHACTTHVPRTLQQRCAHDFPVRTKLRKSSRGEHCVEFMLASMLRRQLSLVYLAIRLICTLYSYAGE